MKIGVALWETVQFEGSRWQVVALDAGAVALRSLDGLGMWAGDGDGEFAEFWLAVLTELKNRGVKNVFFVVCDGLKGLPDSVHTAFPQALVQTCITRLIRNTFRYASRKHWDTISYDLKPIYTAPATADARLAYNEFPEKWGRAYPAIKNLWDTSQTRWAMRWKPALNTFADRIQQLRTAEISTAT